MRKYADIYGGMVRSVRETELEYSKFCSIYSPDSYWVDITGQDEVAPGWLVKFSVERGTYFEAPPSYPIVGLEAKKSAKIRELSEVWDVYMKDAAFKSSLGFYVEADPAALAETAALLYNHTQADVAPLSEDPSGISFIDNNNELRLLSVEELKTVYKEMAINNSSLHYQKYVLRQAIENAEDETALEEISIEFHPATFEEVV
jgi:hypothetical protein